MVPLLISRLSRTRVFFALVVVFLCGYGRLFAAIRWLPFGPDGGDARAFASDPKDHAHLYLGTANGWIYESKDEGGTWRRLARVGDRDDLVLDNIVVDASDPQHLIVGAWMLGSTDGGLYESTNGGTSWKSQPEMKGQSVLALAQAASNPAILVAGTLKGVYRTTDHGAHWTQISPADSKELHEVESIAIDPKDPQTIYAGTWHLPWKTTDGGAKWANIKQGIIDDSDVFSILVDPAKPNVVYASACSGIYKSDNAGGEFHKVQGIPSSARRTRVLMQDPSHLDTVFAGTTEGLFRTEDAGKLWMRTTGEDLIVNDVYVDSSNSKKMLLATDRGGVMASDDGGFSFHSANQGFSARQVTSFVQDRQHPANVYAGVVNDKRWGGVFQSPNDGLNWQQMSGGLEGRDVFSLEQAPDGTILAGTSHGIFKMVDASWTRVADVRSASRAVAAPARKAAAGRVARPAAVKPGAVVAGGSDAAVLALAATPDTMLAATNAGLWFSKDSGNNWTASPDVPNEEWRFLGAAKNWVVAASLHSILRSEDAGGHWKSASLPGGMTQITGVAVDDTGSIWLSGREGVFVSRDNGASWTTPPGLVLKSVDSLYFDARNQRLLITTGAQPSVAFEYRLADQRVVYNDAGWNLRFVRPVGDHFIGATLFDGIVVQPRMVASPIGGGQ